ncbi:MAG: mandelate racemase/muconate lactonizing enzyme family protein [Acidimicrobiales bacterium]
MSKIRLADAWLRDVPVAAVRTDAVQSFLEQETIFVRLETEDGLEGRGYSYTIGTGGTAVLEMLQSYLLPTVVGADAARPEALWDQLRRSSLATMVGPITTLALAAIDTAAWDLRARALGLPLWQLAGGAQDCVPLYDTEGGWLHIEADELVANAVAAVGRGFEGIKVKIGKPRVADDVARIAAVRDAVGPGIAVMVDANQGLTRDEAVRRAHLLEPFDLTWIEEPLPADDVEGHVLLARSTSIPVAVGETLYSLGQFREYLARGAASVVQPDVARIGGITPWLKVAHLAEAFDVPVAPHFLMEIHVSLAAAVPNGRWVEWIPQLESVTTSRILRTDGRAAPPGSPGLGIDWDDAALERTVKEKGRA